MSPKPAMHAPTSTSGGSKPSRHTEAGGATGGIGLALDLGWQLALVVFVPIVAGHLLDSRYHTSPLWTVVGMGVATLAMLGVIIRMQRVMNVSLRQTDPKGAKEDRT